MVGTTTALRVIALGLAVSTAAPPRPPREGDATAQVPGAAHVVRVEALPAPFATPSVDTPARIIKRPERAWPRVPPGFRVTRYADGLDHPRALRTAPGGDVFVTESHRGVLRVLRGLRADGTAERIETFVDELDKPFGVAFYPPGPTPRWLYVANTSAVVRFHYVAGDLHARGEPETIAKLPGGGLLRGGGHWTRDVAFSRDGQKM
jgi:glucose/arabinose dehydrogenase